MPFEPNCSFDEAGWTWKEGMVAQIASEERNKLEETNGGVFPVTHRNVTETDQIDVSYAERQRAKLHTLWCKPHTNEGQSLAADQ